MHKPLLYAGSHVIVWQPTGALQPVPIPGKKNVVSRLNSGQSIAVMHDEVLEIIDLDHINAPRIIAKGVKAFVGSPRSNAVYVVMLNGQLDRLDAASGKVLAVLGEIKQERVRLLIDPQETALWALCFNGGEGFTRAPTDETLIAFSPQAPGVLQQANVAVHQISDTCFLSGMLVTAI